jgi:MFS transporter, AAHS family, 4-hydroxybenzoate transporter
VDIVRLIDEGSMSKLQWLVAVTCALTMFVDGYDMQIMALAVPTIARDWAVDPSRFGLALAAVSIGLGASGAFLAPRGDRLGRRTLVIAGLVLVGLATLATAAASSAAELVVWRFVTGIGLGLGIPNCNAWTSEYTPRASRATALVLMNACIAIGAFSAGNIAPAVLAAWGWRGTFIVGGCVPLAIAVVAFTATPESLKFLLTRRPGDPRIGRVLAAIAPRLRGVTLTLPDATAPPPRPSIVELFRPVFRARTLMLWGVVLANLFTLWLLISWLPTLLEKAGWSGTAAVRGAVLIQAGGVVGGIVLSRFVDRGRTLPALRSAFLLAALALMLFAVAPSGAAWVLMLALIGCGVNGAQLALNALSTAYYPPAIKATGMSWVGVAGQVGSSAAPLVGQWLLAAGVAATHILALLGAVPLLCALATLRMRPEWQGD